MTEPRINVSFRYDSPDHSPRSVAEYLQSLTYSQSPEIDEYLLGGSVRNFEQVFAHLVGKEMAIFMPTGTLANHLAVRALAKGRKRVLVQERGHIYNDSGDCLQQLSGFNVVPLGKGQVSYTLDEVREAVQVAGDARVRVDLGALVIETPVRRMHGARFDHEEMRRICAYGREHGIGLHLDGARIFIASAYSGIPVKEYTALFDTVYVSLYKYLGPPCGAVLAGPAAILEGLHHERRMFGGALNQGWMLASMALSNLERCTPVFAEVVTVSERFKDQLRGVPGFTVTDIPAGTNICRLEVEGDAESFRSRLAQSGVTLPKSEGGGFYLKMNESLFEAPTESLVERFRKAL